MNAPVFSVPLVYGRKAPIKRPMPDGFMEIFRTVLKAEKAASCNQRDTPRRTFQRLRDELVLRLLVGSCMICRWERLTTTYG